MSLNMFPLVGDYLTKLSSNDLTAIGDTSGTDQGDNIEANLTLFMNKINELIDALNKANGGTGG